MGGIILSVKRQKTAMSGFLLAEVSAYWLSLPPGFKNLKSAAVLTLLGSLALAGCGRNVPPTEKPAAAAKGKASPASMIAALRLAARIATVRARR